MKKDYICHVHTDCRQPWQNSHVLRNLLGPDNIFNIINIFLDHKEVGLIYPEPYHGVPYIEYARRSDTEAEHMIFQKLRLNRGPVCYIDFPAEGMFWACVDAIKPLLDLQFRTRISGMERAEPALTT